MGLNTGKNRLPDGSYGKQFIVKASFLRHVNDEPRFSMPLTTEDLAAALDRQLLMCRDIGNGSFSIEFEARKY